ncbi:hypothetical protein ACFQGA_07415 [Marinobacter koreensis]|uniref:Uncharacterized protein n=1 Tax=Marinobacter koreensis TaxID=335974 RepID=A0ABW0RJR7_9GAMM|nr:hypothetical protein [Marinobacter koreensis]MCK7546793.1 hypothetical protein [Marinobacter koreensis]
MNRRKLSTMAAGALASALLIASPLALADHHGKDAYGKRDMSQVCEDFREGTGKFSPEARQERREKYRAEADKRHAEMADRLKLDKEQRKVWDEMQMERRQQHEARAEKWRERLAERCANQDQ